MRSGSKVKGTRYSRAGWAALWMRDATVAVKSPAKEEGDSLLGDAHFDSADSTPGEIYYL